MSDITRDDLFVNDPETGMGQLEVTDEEFDRLARDAGYVKLDDEWKPPTGWVRSDVRLRALLTDQCEHGESKPHIAAQKGMAQMVWTCPGWLPKDGVILAKIQHGLETPTVYCIPFDWLEAEDE